LFNYKAAHFTSLTPWNKTEMLNEICLEGLGTVYMSDATFDELDICLTCQAPLMISFIYHVEAHAHVTAGMMSKLAANQRLHQRFPNHPNHP
jgi:hypothetical protein